MLYIFVCVSEKCIGTASAVHCFSCLVPHVNDLGVKFLEDGQFNEAAHKTDNQLRALGYRIPVKRKEESKVEEDS